MVQSSSSQHILRRRAEFLTSSPPSSRVTQNVPSYLGNAETDPTSALSFAEIEVFLDHNTGKLNFSRMATTGNEWLAGPHTPLSSSIEKMAASVVLPSQFDLSLASDSPFFSVPSPVFEYRPAVTSAAGLLKDDQVIIALGPILLCLLCFFS